VCLCVLICILVSKTYSDDNVNAISASSLMGVKHTTASWYRQTKKNNLNKNFHKPKLNGITSTKVLACVLWILKNLDNDVMRTWLADCTRQRANNTLSILTLCIKRFYNGSNKKVSVVVKRVCVSFAARAFRRSIKHFVFQFRVTVTNVRIATILNRRIRPAPRTPRNRRPTIYITITVAIITVCRRRPARRLCQRRPRHIRPRPPTTSNPDWKT